jgi:hypothetical protein
MKIITKIVREQHGYGAATFLLLLLLVIVIWMELQGGIFERMGGKVMVWSNAHRPRLGRVWEYQSASASALEKLEKLATEQKQIRRELLTLQDFSALSQQLTGGGMLIISREKFLELYQKLPKIFAQRISTPRKLLEYTTNSSWYRTAFAGRNDGLDLYFLNANNYVIEKVSLSTNYFNLLQRWGTKLNGDLESDLDFNGRVFSAEEFISAWSQIENSPEQDALSEELLKTGTEMTKVGISRQLNDGLVEIGFLYANGRTILFSIEDNFALQLLEKLPETIQE